MSTTRTITLTGRPPVTIDESKWPLIASASDKDHDNQYEFQANRLRKWWIGVRQHADGRALVYGKYSYTSRWEGERDRSYRAGVLLPKSSGLDAICEAIGRVANDISTSGHDGDDDMRWPTLAAECIADLPAETLE